MPFHWLFAWFYRLILAIMLTYNRSSMYSAAGRVEVFGRCHKPEPVSSSNWRCNARGVPVLTLACPWRGFPACKAPSCYPGTIKGSKQRYSQTVCTTSSPAGALLRRPRAPFYADLAVATAMKTVSPVRSTICAASPEITKICLAGV